MRSATSGSDRGGAPVNISPSCQPPSEAEIASRVRNVQAQMARQGLDLYLCADADNIAYLTNFYNFVHERPFVLLIPLRGDPVFLAPKLEQPHVRARAIGRLALLEYFEFPAPQGQAWSDRLRDVVAAEYRVGVEARCPYSVVNALPSVPRVVDIVDDLRMVKSDYEISRIAYTSGLLSEGHRLLLEEARPGQPILELNSKVSAAMSRRLMADNPRTNIVATSLIVFTQPPLVSHDPHNYTDLKLPIAEGGPHVTVVAGRANGYGAEVERCFFLGFVPQAARRPFDDMIAARELAFELCRPGMLMSDVDRQVNALLRARGHGEHLLHRTGHSFGVTNHEAPFLAEGYDREILPGMVFSIEPGVYLPGVGGFRFSDTVLVTEAGNRALTEAPTAIEELTLAIR
jgi:Xaa-Pro dipeptidase